MFKPDSSWMTTPHNVLVSVPLRCEDACRGQLTQWDVFMRQMQPLAAQMPWMLIEGVSYRTMYTVLDGRLALRYGPCMHCSLML